MLKLLLDHYKRKLKETKYSINFFHFNDTGNDTGFYILKQKELCYAEFIKEIEQVIIADR